MRPDNLLFCHSACCAICLCLSLAQAACAYCDRDDSADGTYAVVSDCSGTLKQGALRVGASTDGIGSGDLLDDLWERCATTAVEGAEALGLPGETVTVEGERRFSLSGAVHGLQLSCESENFGSEDILFCRTPDGALQCVAFVE